MKIIRKGSDEFSRQNYPKLNLHEKRIFFINVDMVLIFGAKFQTTWKF